jgi:outer membrane lipoprotein-sorting protein
MFTMLVLMLAAFPLHAEPRTLTEKETEILVRELTEQRRRHGSFSARFEEERYAGLTKEPIKTSGSIQFKVPNLMRREVEGENPSLMVSDGTNLWIHYPRLGEAERYPLTARGRASQIFQIFQTAVDFEALPGNFSISAKENATLTLRLEPKRPALKRSVKAIVLHFTQTRQLIGMEVAAANGSVIHTRYSAVSHEPIKEDLFRFTPPAGTKVVEIGM